MTTPHDKLRDACERTANAQVTFKAADAAGSGHVAAASVLMEACADLSTHIPTILALLDENARLRASAEEAHPRALQAAADVLLRQPSESEWLDDYFRSLADDILGLSAEQIDAFDRQHESQAAFGRAVAAVPLATDAPEEGGAS